MEDLTNSAYTASTSIGLIWNGAEYKQFLWKGADWNSLGLPLSPRVAVRSFKNDGLKKSACPNFLRVQRYLLSLRRPIRGDFWSTADIRCQTHEVCW
jgi:hypothetical protein